MTVSKTVITSTSPPGGAYSVGEGSFLVGFWGEGIKYTKNAKLWYEHPKQMDWAKGSYAELDDLNTNDIEKTLNFASTPIFIHSLKLDIRCTATVYNRIISISIIGNNEKTDYTHGSTTANEITLVHFGDSFNDSDLTGTRSNDICLPKFWSSNLPFWNKIKINVSSSDSNDDLFILMKGVYAVPKYHWVLLKNCNNLQFSHIPDTRGDVLGEDNFDFTPVSLRVIKI